jgi:pyrimidine-nucleoside phosphorylase
MVSYSKLIDDFSRLRTEGSMSRLIAAARETKLTLAHLHRFANVMAKSGNVLEWSGDGITADLASTGGPTSLSTLLGPLYLHSYGFLVPKLGVPGRPAGGIDVLAQLPGYRIIFTPREIRDVVTKCGYVHFLASDNFAPLDALLFAYRQKADSQNVPLLAVASLLAKKIASGVMNAGLDVRVASHGNFGGTFAEARQFAKMFCAAAHIAGISAVAVMTDARTPYQPFVGRGEALLALKLIFDGRAEPWLSGHNSRCRLMAAHVASLSDRQTAEGETHNIRTSFVNNIEAQGSSVDAFETKVDAVMAGHRYKLIATDEGFLKLDIALIRDTFTKVHSRLESACQFADELGLILKVPVGSYVKRGDLLATVRATDGIWSKYRLKLENAFQAVDLLEYAPGMEETIRG